MCFGVVAVAVDRVLRHLKKKMLRIANRWAQKFPVGVSQNLAARVLQQLDFLFGKCLLPTFEKQTVG